jgi:hypothetical protein
MALRAKARWLPRDTSKVRPKYATMVAQSEGFHPPLSGCGAPAESRVCRPPHVKGIAELPDDIVIDGWASGTHRESFSYARVSRIPIRVHLIALPTLRLSSRPSRISDHRTGDVRRLLDVRGGSACCKNGFGPLASVHFRSSLVTRMDGRESITPSALRRNPHRQGMLAR